VAFVNNGFTGGEIERVINTLSGIVTGAGKRVVVLNTSTELSRVCRSTLRGVSPCYGAVIFNASPTEGTGGMWNYTIKADSSLGGGGKINVNRDDNDSQVYVLPFQQAIDATIASTNNGTNNQVPLASNTRDFLFTALTVEERNELIRTRYQQALINAFGVAFFAGMVGICYHLTGFVATEREAGMATLIDAMMPTKRPWHAQAARLLSYHLSFTFVYLPSWVIGSLILRQGVFAHTNVGIILIYHILNGLALASTSLFGASFFKKAQLSGVTVTLILTIVAIIAQSISYPKTSAVIVLSLLFAPSNYAYFTTFVARWEQQEVPTNLTQVAPGSPWNVSGIVLWVFLILQIIIYPILAALVEKWLHGTTTSARTIIMGPIDGDDQQGNTVKLEGFTKIYKPGFVRRIFSFISQPKPEVVAVNGLNLAAGRGQILALLGANGSGKSTTLDSIAGTNSITSGKITIDGSGGLGIAPQKNVLWDELTVEEHIAIFNKLKSPAQHATQEENHQLIKDIDLDRKIRAFSKTLSGGQKRKLQLGMMLTGGSAVCCVDEVSSGLDPISRRKIWDILLGERGRRTIILTTHFLDEADLLADHIAILSKGTLRAEGSSVELKDRFGGGYRVHVYNTADSDATPEVAGVTKIVAFDAIKYLAPSSSLAAQVIKTLEANGIMNYRFSGPTIEDVFLHLAEEVRELAPKKNNTSVSATSPDAPVQEKQGPSENVMAIEDTNKDGLALLSGRQLGFFQQTWVLFLKRCTIFKNNWFPYVAAFLLPILAAGLVTIFVKNQQPIGCDPSEQGSTTAFANQALNLFSEKLKIWVVGGPPSKFNEANLVNVFLPIYRNLLAQNSSSSSGGSVGPSRNLFENLTLVNTFDEFNSLVVQDRKNITPAGIWLGDDNSPPTLAILGGAPEIEDAWFSQWVMNMLLTNTSHYSSYVMFDIPWAPDTGNSLQLLVYMGLIFAAYPGFFALYPNTERRRHVRGLQYSNGVRVVPLWLAYVLFDFAIVVVSMAIVTILFATGSQVWYHVAYLFPIFVLYGLTAILLAYLISLFAANQLSAYAFTAASQAFFFVVYLIAYLCTITYAPINRVDDYLLLVHFLVSAFAPIGSIARALFLTLNLFSATCVDFQLATNPGGILQYGGPLLYLVVQAILLFLLIIWLDSGNVGSTFKRLLHRNKTLPDVDPQVSDEEVANECVRVSTAASDAAAAGASTDGLRAVHLTKAFGKNTAVDNVTFGIRRGEVFALLGPNGAGKSTTISLIRGDIKPSVAGGDVFVEDISVTKHLAAARSHLGVCPQFDAIDQMTVTEHLRFYARARGIPDIDHNVSAVLQAVGLTAFKDRQAHALSGGNKRKLSLGIALMGNPTVVLLDEPSSGLDAAAKRIMWRTLAATVPGRSILLTTHSMEEADALAGRAGIMARRMLAMGTTDQLRQRFGDALHIHLVCRGAPRTSEADVHRVREWVAASFPGAQIEDKTYHGQMRFSLPASSLGREKDTSSGDDHEIQSANGSSVKSLSYTQSAIGRLVVLLEENKDKIGIQHYSVSPTTLDQVFLAVVGKHGVQEEGYDADRKKSIWRRWF
jgi:ABC-type multidrug transport system ATPase subunit